MHCHAKAALTASQRKTIQQFHRDGASISELARRFGLHRRTIQRWVGRQDVTDHSSAPHRHGPKRIAQALRPDFPTANVATVWRILKAAGLSKPAPKKTEAPTDTSWTPSSATGHPGVVGD